MSQFYRTISALDTFVIGDHHYDYIAQVVVENYTKSNNWESKLNTRLRRVLNELDVTYSIITPYTRNAPATYITMEQNAAHVDVIRLIDQLRFEDQHITAKPYLFTNLRYNCFPLHQDFSKESQRIAVQRFNSDFYPVNSRETWFRSEQQEISITRPQPSASASSSQVIACGSGTTNVAKKRTQDVLTPSQSSEAIAKRPEIEVVEDPATTKKTTVGPKVVHEEAVDQLIKFRRNDPSIPLLTSPPSVSREVELSEAEKQAAKDNLDHELLSEAIMEIVNDAVVFLKTRLGIKEKKAE